MPTLSRFADDLGQIVAGESICPRKRFPALDESYVLDDLQSLDIPFGEAELIKHAGQVDPKKIEAPPQALSAREDFVGYNPQPITDLTHEHLGIASMSADVIARDIGQYALIAIALFLKDQALLVLEARGSVIPAPQIEPELEGHVETRLVSRVKSLDPRDVVNAVSARTDKVADLVDPGTAGVGLVRCEPGLEATLEDDEDQRLKEWDVLSIERTVDEETALEAIEAPRHRAL